MQEKDAIGANLYVLSPPIAARARLRPLVVFSMSRQSKEGFVYSQ